MNSTKSKIKQFKPLQNAFFIFFLYTIFIVSLLIYGQIRIEKYEKRQLDLELKNSSNSLENAIFLTGEYLNILSESRYINTYFKNKALGMSLKYGLKASLLKIENEFEDLINNKRIKGNSVFDSICLLDSNNNILVSKNSQDLTFLREYYNSENKDIDFILIDRDKNLKLYLVKKIFINNNKISTLISEINFKNIIDQLIYGDKTKRDIFLKFNGKYYDSNSLSLVSKNVNEFSSYNLQIVNLKLIHSNELSKTFLTSKVFIFMILILSVIIFLLIYNFFRSNYRNEILRHRIETQINSNAYLKNKVSEKTKELEDINANLKEMVEDEISKNLENKRIIYNQSKMAIMGQMIDNIAHQWRQPLSAISSTASSIIVQDKLNILDNKTVINSMNNIMDSTKFLSETIEDFRGFLKEKKEKEIVNLREVYIKTTKLLISVTKNSGVVYIENIDSKANIYGFSNELVQVLMNIINNAYDAFSNTNRKNRFLFVDIWEDETFAYIKIKDSAGGIDEEIIDKVFDAHFSTKLDTTGTGIGLYMTKEIVINHLKGSIDVSNELYNFEGATYKGATFFIKLPKK